MAEAVSLNPDPICTYIEPSWPWQPYEPWKPFPAPNPIIPQVPVPYVPTRTVTTVTVSPPKPDKSKALAAQVVRNALAELKDLLDPEQRKAVELALDVLEGK